MQNEISVPNKFRNFSLILIPGATVFIASFCVMAMELVAGRLIARHLGSSLYTWTSVIGVVLTGITIGNYAGGRIADKFDAKKALSAIFVIGSVACVLTIVFNNIINDWILLWKLNWPLRVFSHVSLLFLLPSALLGTISPVVAKMALDRGLPQGRTVGDIYACGAAGSIAGTFAAGYYLVAMMGTIAIIWAVGAVLLLMAVLYRLRFWPLYLWVILFAIILITATGNSEFSQMACASLLLREPPDPEILYEDESQYCYIAVRQSPKNPEQRLFMQDKLMHSEIIMNDINDLQYFYTKIYTCVTRELSKNKGPINVMVIGGGGYVYPRYIEQNWPGSRIEVVEIDPGVTRAAIAAFGLSENSSIKTLSMDARNYVEELLDNQKNGRQMPLYDFIYEDAINDYAVPYQLVTKEFNDKIYKLLADDGAYMVNLIDTYDSARFLGAVVDTLQQTFPHVYVATDEDSHPAVRETFVVVATKHPFDMKAAGDKEKLRLWNLNESEIQTIIQKANATVLTDNYAPVENLLAPVARQDAKEMLAREYMRQAQQLQREQKWQQSIKMYEKTLSLNPTMAIKVYNEIGMMQAAQNNFQQSIDAFQKAIYYHTHPGHLKNAVGSVYLNLGTLLSKMGRQDEAKQPLTKAVEQFHIEMVNEPNTALIWSRIGDAYATMGDFNSASDAFQKAADFEPGNITYWYSLAQTLELQNRLDDAIEAANKGIELGIDREGMLATMKQYLTRLEQKKAARQP